MLNIKKWFTLVEILISTVIIWILFWVIFSSYTQISNLALKIENERNLSNEILFLTQNIQNLADTYTIDYYFHNDLWLSNWYTNSLFFTWSDFVNIYLTWDTIWNLFDIRNSSSWIEMNINWDIIKLTDPEKIFIKNFYFKIIPIENWRTNRWVPFDEIYNFWFWIFIDAYTSNYHLDRWPFDVSIQHQTFFNIRQY